MGMSAAASTSISSARADAAVGQGEDYWWKVPIVTMRYSSLEMRS
jgi:hypothetical protein